MTDKELKQLLREAENAYQCQHCGSCVKTDHLQGCPNNRNQPIEGE